MKKIIHSSIMVGILLILSFFFGDEYISFHHNKQSLEQQKQELSTHLEKFGFHTLQEISGISYSATPDKKVLDNIISLINSSQEKLYIEVYMITNNRFIQAIQKAQKRGVQVKIILERNPYKSGNINKKAFESFQKSGINVVWSNVDNYSLNHSKMMIIDDIAILSTGNLTYSTFTKNRDLFVQFSDLGIVSKLEQIFLQDFSGSNNYIYHPNLVVSPHYSREKIEYLIENAKNSLDIYAQYIQDESIEQLLIEKAKSGVNIRLLVSKNYMKDDDNQKQINTLKQAGIFVWYPSKYKMHSKAILVDKKYLFIGSINMSSYSFDSNREFGIITSNKQVISEFLSTFEKDTK